MHLRLLRWRRTRRNRHPEAASRRRQPQVRGLMQVLLQVQVLVCCGIGSPSALSYGNEGKASLASHHWRVAARE